MSSLADFHFIRPYWLLALVPFVVIVILLVKNKLGSSNWSSVCDADLLPYLLQEKAVNQSRWPITTTAIAVLLVITALAGPTWQRMPSPVFRNDSALVIALNLSKSMDAEDIKPSRLIRARYKIADILQQRKDGQTAAENDIPGFDSAGSCHHGHEQSANGQPVAAADSAQGAESARRNHVFCLLRRWRLERDHADWRHEGRWRWRGQEQDSKIVTRTNRLPPNRP